MFVTLGAEGCGVASADHTFVQAAMPVTAVDATGAGDTFCGALAAALVHGEPMRQAVRFATVAAGLATTKAGAQPAIPMLSEIEEAASASSKA